MPETDADNPRQPDVPHRRDLQRRNQLWLDRFRHRLAHLDALPQLTILGFLIGLAAAGLVVAFRLAIDLPLAALFSSHSEDFESLPRHWHFLLPLGGALVIGLILHFTPAANRSVSVAHVLERLHNHQGKMPAGNWLVQLVGGILALLSGQSLGREGPAVHLGAGVASQLGQWLRLPNNCLRTLIGCGAASAIAASFNTPMAGVIFSMEVILMEYTIAGFVPVIMASVTGAAIGRMMFGSEPAFSVTAMQLQELWGLPLVALAGLVVAVFAALFIRAQLYFNARQHYPVLPRMLLAGLVTGLIALWYPQILGVGYDTIEAAMHGQLALPLLLAVLLAKLVASTLSSGLGMPGGLIGPMLFVGAVLGGALGLMVEQLLPGSPANPGFYVLLGMGAMMAATMNAPLTALITVFELTHNPHTLFPTMLIIVVAVLTTRQLFRCEGVFIAQLEANGYRLSGGPVRQALNRVGVRSVMEPRFQLCRDRLTLAELNAHLRHHPAWLVVDEPEQDKHLLAAADISAWLDTVADEPPQTVRLLDIPGRQWLLKPIHQQASLLEAQQQIDQLKADALYVERQSSPWLSPVIGIITREHIDNFYRV